jgi:Ca2+-binding EF-hand superfamily protein
MQYKITHSVNFFKDKTEYVDVNEFLEVCSNYVKEDRNYNVRLLIKVSDINTKSLIDILLFIGSIKGLNIKFSKKDSHVGYHLDENMNEMFDKNKFNFVFTTYTNFYDTIRKLTMYINKILRKRRTYIDSIIIELYEVL